MNQYYYYTIKEILPQDMILGQLKGLPDSAGSSGTAEE